MIQILNNAHEKTGTYPQVREVTWHDSGDEFWRANQEYDPVLNGTEPAPTLHMMAGAKTTDALSVVAKSWRFLVVNQKLLDYLQSVRSDGLRILPTMAVKNGEKYPYWLVAIDNIRDEYINFPASRFMFSDGSGQPSEVEISDYEEFMRKKPTLPKKLYAIDVAINESMIQLDIFRLPPFTGAPYFVSEKFRQGVEQAKITGLKFSPIPKEPAALVDGNYYTLLE